jgi:hypothetical protein
LWIHIHAFDVKVLKGFLIYNIYGTEERRKMANNVNEIGYFKCKRCWYTTDKKFDILRHFDRKNKCSPSYDSRDTNELREEVMKASEKTSGFPCKYCGKFFSSIPSRCRHAKHHCKSKREEKSDIDLLKQQVSELTDKISTITSTISQTNNTNTNTTTNSNNTNTNTNNTMINNNTTINMPVLRNFGEENMDAIPLQFIRDCYMNLNLKMLFEELHCTPEYPENHNVRLKSTKRELLEIYKDNKWKSMCYQDGFREVIEQMYRIFIDFSKDNKDLIIEDLNDEELIENEQKLEKIYQWVADTQQRIKTIKEVKQIAAVLDTNRV